jgi:hypothetical protein
MYRSFLLFCGEHKHMLEVLKKHRRAVARGFRTKEIFVENLLLRNEGGQLGLGHTKDRQCPTLITELTGHNIVQVGSSLVV